VKREIYDRLKDYRKFEFCVNCAKVEDVSEEFGESPLSLLHCLEMVNGGVDDIRVDKKHICNSWRRNQKSLKRK